MGSSESAGAVWLINPAVTGSRAITAGHDDLRWMTLRSHMASSGVDIVAMDGTAIDSLAEPRAVAINGINRTAPEVMGIARLIRQRFPVPPIYVTGRAGRQIAAAADVDRVIHTSEDRLASGILPDGRLAECTESAQWWQDATPARPDGPHLPLGVLEVEATRGCTYHCSVLAHAADPRHQWLPRSVDAIAAEIAHWHCATGVDRVRFVDHNFLGSPVQSPPWADQLATELLWRAPTLTFSIHARLDRTLLRSLPSLHAAGLVQVHARIEGASNAALHRLAKGATIEEMGLTLGALAGLGIEVIPSFIVFEPHGTPQDVLDTLDWIEVHSMEAWFTPTATRAFDGTGQTQCSAADSGSAHLNPDGITNPQAIRFADPKVALACRVAAAFDREVGAHLEPGLDELMRHRMARDGDLLRTPMSPDPKLAKLMEYRRAQMRAIRSVLGGRVGVRA